MMVTRTQLKKLNKLWKHLPEGLNDYGREEYIKKIAPLFRLTTDDLAELIPAVEYNKEKDRFVKK